MSQHPTTIRDLTGNPHLERLELQDIGARNVQDPDAFDHVDDEMSERDADAAFVAEMERRDREAATTFCGTPDDDTDPTRPGGAALPARYAHFAEQVKRWPDANLIIGIGLADRGELDFTGDDKPAKNAAWLNAATAEVLRRLAA